MSDETDVEEVEYEDLPEELQDAYDQGFDLGWKVGTSHALDGLDDWLATKLKDTSLPLDVVAFLETMKRDFKDGMPLKDYLLLRLSELNAPDEHGAN